MTNKKRTERRLTLRWTKLHDKVIKELEKLAIKNGRSLNSEILKSLEAYVNERS